MSHRAFLTQAAMFLAFTLLWGAGFPPELCQLAFADVCLTAALVCLGLQLCRRRPGPPPPGRSAWQAAPYGWPRDYVRREGLSKAEPQGSSPAPTPRAATSRVPERTSAAPTSTRAAGRPAEPGHVAPLQAHEWMAPGPVRRHKR